MMNRAERFHGGCESQPKSAPVSLNGFPFVRENYAKIGVEPFAVLNLKSLWTVTTVHISHQFAQEEREGLPAATG